MNGNPVVAKSAPLGNYWELLLPMKHCKEWDGKGINMDKPSTNWCRIF